MFARLKDGDLWHIAACMLADRGPSSVAISKLAAHQQASQVGDTITEGSWAVSYTHLRAHETSAHL
eukprot:3365938-Alexandrium_andersonii.AAC.1